MVYPIAVRQRDFFTNSDPQWFSYFARDVFRSAEFIGPPFVWASPDPVLMDARIRTYPREQPYIHRLALAAERAGLDLAEMEAAIAAAPERFDSAIESSQDAQRTGGHHGMPLMVFNGEPFFGQDRFDQFKWRMLRKGLAKR